MKRKLFLGLVFVCAILLSIQIGKQVLSEVFGIVPKGGLKVASVPDATVYLNGIEVGKTPYRDDNLNTGEYLVKLISDNSNWQGKIVLTKGTLSVINRSLAPSVASSSGETLVLDKGQGVIVTSSPADAVVEIDGKQVGKTPLFVSLLSSGVHGFNISHDGYLTRVVDVVLPADLALHINVDLALVERHESITVTPTVAVVKKIKIKQTPLGYLRLRESPSINSKEVAQVSSGEELEVVLEVPGWTKVRLKNNLEGYVSSQYVQKIP
ncbi:MAG: PEGA domain-containing protein [Microgenomates group bacterium]|jgi:hypothetical protein